MVRFQTQGPGVSLQNPNWDAEYKRQTPFKQIVGLYNMWQSLSPDTRNAIAKLFGGGEDEILDAPAEMGRDEVLDKITNPDAGSLQIMPDGSYSQIGELNYIDDDRPSTYQPKNVIDVDVGATDPWGIGQISTEPAKSTARRDIAPALTLGRADIADPTEFLAAKEKSSADLPSGHYDNAWRGLF